MAGSKHPSISESRIRHFTRRVRSRFKSRPRSVAKTYADSFTINGLTKIATGKAWERILWLVVLSIALTIVGIQAAKFICEYRKYDVRTQVHVVEGEKAKLPDLVVCTHDFLKNSTFLCRNGRNIVKSRRNLLCDIEPSLTVKIFKPMHGSSEKFPKFPKKCVHLKNLTGVNSLATVSIRTNLSNNLNVFIVEKDHTYLSATVGQSITNLKRGAYILTLSDHKVYTRLQAPYRSNCSNGENMDVAFSGGYTQFKCWETYFIRRMLADCGTVLDIYLPYVKSSYRKRNNTNMTEGEIDKCLYDILKPCETDECFSQCPRQCHEETYMVKEIRFRDDDEWYVSLEQWQHRTTYIQEVPAYTMERLLSEVGGYLGLFVGMSILSLIEIIVYVVTSIKERYYGFD